MSSKIQRYENRILKITKSKSPVTAQEWIVLNIKYLCALLEKEQNDKAASVVLYLHEFSTGNRFYDDEGYRSCYLPYFYFLMGKLGNNEGYYLEALRITNNSYLECLFGLYKHYIDRGEYEKAKMCYYNLLIFPRGINFPEYIWGANHEQFMEYRVKYFDQFLKECFPNQIKTSKQVFDEIKELMNVKPGEMEKVEADMKEVEEGNKEKEEKKKKSDDKEEKHYYLSELDDIPFTQSSCLIESL